MRLQVKHATPVMLVLYYRPVYIWIAAGMFAVTAVASVAMFAPLLTLNRPGDDPTGMVSYLTVTFFGMGCMSGVTMAAVAFLLLAFLGRIEECTLDKTAGIARIERRGVLGVKVDECALRDIVGVDVRQRLGRHGQRFTRIYLLLASGQRLPVSYWAYDIQSASKAGMIRRFLGRS